MYSKSLQYRRRPERSRAKVWLGLAGVLLLVAFGGPTGVAYLVSHPPREHISGSPAEMNLAFQELRVPGRETESDLSGWWVAADGSETTVILVHDYGRNRLQAGVALPLAKELTRAGYNVVLYDQRAHGTASPGTSATLGGREPGDLGRMVSHVKSLGTSGRHVVLMGWSLGANVALRAAAERPEVEALVLDSPTADVWGRLDREIDAVSPYPSFFFTRYVRWLAVLLFGVRPSGLRPLDEIRAVSPRPVLLIQGESGVGERLLHLSGRAGNELYAVAGSEPGEAYQSAPEAYAAKLISFLRRTFP